jgi:ElaB/YqjD/DUF883 family membrane-anchored ribosome-binding protein
MSNGSQTSGRSRTPRDSKPGSSDMGNVSIQPAAEADSVASQAEELAAKTKDATAALSADLREAATSMGRAAKEQASEFAAGIGSELGKTAEGQKARGVETLQCFVRAIGSAAGELESQSPKVAQSVRQAASKVGNLSDTISNRSVDELLKAATDLARSQPLAFMGGAALAGFALSRFLKSSSRNSDAGSGSRSST